MVVQKSTAMKTTFSVFLRILPLIAIAALAYWWSNRNWDPANRHSPEEAQRSIKKIGETAADFTLERKTQSKQESFKLSSLQGKAVVLNFWATWCGPCIKELPSLLSVAKRYRERGLVVVAVSVDRDWATIERFLTRQPQLAEIMQEFVVVLDPKLAVANQYGVDRFPETFLLRRDQQVELRLSGEQVWDDPRYTVYYDRILE